ncbi:hypothetical protein V493_04831 [Pseudogymnoascus sp. VKM F-4281 (FW-2241)]|nr:hypothetical protein V493_04831 [Pseudogymnoascus sp. VKM F-4281 (FW-2241)]
MRSTSTSALVAALLAIAPADAFWRLPCRAPLLFERTDPIVNPGTISAHAHTIMGGNGFSNDMNFADTQASTCSSCTVTKDFSNYWVPNLYYKGQDGSFTSVEQVGGGLIYYLQRSDPKDPEYDSGLLAFPEGFRMLAGDPMLRSFSDTLEQRAISYACLGTDTKETNEIPNINCPNGLRAQVFFPSCWDGKNLDSPDHKSHMAYPSLVDNGNCPESHPKRFISLFYEVIWDTPKFADQWNGDKHPFVFSNGDETGYGYHGDFVNGWDVPTLQRAVTECTNLSGVVEDCPVFDFFEDEEVDNCKIQSTIDEKIQGTLAALPGCNPSTGEGARAVTSKDCAANPTVGNGTDSTDEESPSASSVATASASASEVPSSSSASASESSSAPIADQAPPDTNQNNVQVPDVVQKTYTVFPVAEAKPTAVVDTNAHNQCAGIVTVTVAEATVTVTQMGNAFGGNAAVVEKSTAAQDAVQTGAPEGSAPKDSAAPVETGPTATLPTLLPSATGIYTNGTKHNGHGHGHGPKHPHQRPSSGFARPTGGHGRFHAGKGN